MRYSVPRGKVARDGSDKTDFWKRNISILPRAQPPQQKSVDGREPRTLPASSGEAFSRAAGGIVAIGPETGFAIRHHAAARRQFFAHQPRHPFRKRQNALPSAHVSEV